MSSKVPESTRLAYARQLADEALTLVPGVERLAEIVVELRTGDLYRLLGFDTWEQFCKGYLGVSRWTANRLIAGPKPKSITAGQSAAAVQDAPIVESVTLKIPAASTEASAKQSEGAVHASETVSGHLTGTPSGPSSGGAELQPSAEPTDEAAPKWPSSRSAPPDPSRNNNTGPVPSLRQEAHFAFEALHDAQEGIGAKWTVEEATYWENRSKREMDAWRAAHGIAPPAPAEKPQRRQGTITRPQAAVLAGRAIEVNGAGKRRASQSPEAPAAQARRQTAREAGDLTRRDVHPMFKGQ